MEKTDSYIEIKTILQDIQKAIEIYNHITKDEKISIVTETPRDVRDIFICFYNKEHVGLFQKISCYSTVDKINQFSKYEADDIYLGIDSSYIGIKNLHHNYDYTDKFQRCGKSVTFHGTTYVANCHMEDAMSFEQMRFIMYKSGIISSYTLGKATSREILDVLCYANNYFVKEMQSTKEKRK